MFDRDSGRGILLGSMIRNYRIAEHNGRAADRSRATAQHNYDVAMEVLAENEKLRARIAQLEAHAAVDAMHIAGLEAQRDAYMEQHANSPLLQDSGRRFKESGNIKTKGRLVYEAAFDAKGHVLGIANPAAHRND